MRAVLIILFFLVAFVKSFGQPYQGNPAGWFTVDEFKGCSPFVVTITAPLCDGSKSCTIVRGNGGPNKILSTITDTLIYNTPGIFTLGLYVVSDYSEIQINAFPNIQPDFEIYHCSGKDVQVKVTDVNYNYEYKINYNDGSPIQIKAAGTSAKDNHTFLSAGSKTIDVRGVIAADAADNCSAKSDTILIKNTAISVPSINQLEVLTPSSIKLDFVNQYHVLYKLEIAANTNTIFQQLQNIYNTSTANISSSISPDAGNFYCFRLGINNPCTNSTSYSANQICSADFDVAAVDNQNNLNWVTESSGVLNYTISKTPGTAIQPQAPSKSSYPDNDVICQPYTYQLISNYSNGKSISLPKTVSSFSNTIPPAVDNITTSLNPEGTIASLIWQPGSQPQEYSVLKNNSLLTTTTTETFIDENYSLSDRPCYSISYKNQCNNTAAQTTSCPIKIESKLQDDNSVVLTWSDYTGWKNSVSGYTVEKYSAQGQFISVIYSGTNTTFTDNNLNGTSQSFYYVVKAHPNDPGVNEPALSNTVYAILDPKILWPKAFTPDHNGDTKNENFKPVRHDFVVRFEIQIFNRWGELMFSTDNINEGWDGTYKGLPVPEGIYAYNSKITDELGRKFTRKGSVLLLRTR